MNCRNWYNRSAEASVNQGSNLRYVNLRYVNEANFEALYLKSNLKLTCKEPKLEPDSYISTLVILLPDRDLYSWANQEPEFKV